MSFLMAVKGFLEGKKTYLFSLGLVALALYQTDGALWQEIDQILVAAALASLRAGVSKVVPPQ